MSKDGPPPRYQLDLTDPRRAYHRPDEALDRLISVVSGEQQRVNGHPVSLTHRAYYDAANLLGQLASNQQTRTPTAPDREHEASVDRDQAVSALVRALGRAPKDDEPPGFTRTVTRSLEQPGVRHHPLAFRVLTLIVDPNAEPIASPETAAPSPTHEVEISGRPLLDVDQVVLHEKRSFVGPVLDGAMRSLKQLTMEPETSEAQRDAAIAAFAKTKHSLSASVGTRSVQARISELVDDERPSITNPAVLADAGKLLSRLQDERPSRMPSPSAGRP